MSEDEVKLLNIKKLRRNDTGDYLCRVLNEYGFADLIHHLIVLPGKEIQFYNERFELISLQHPNVRLY
jgi:hypothetical protein